MGTLANHGATESREMRPHVAEISAADAATAEYPEMRPNLAE